MFEFVLHSEFISKQLFFDSRCSWETSPKESESDIIANWELVI